MGTEFEEAIRRGMKRAQRKEEKRKVSLKLASWNVNSFPMRVIDIESFTTHKELDVQFVCKTLQRR